MPTSNGDRPFTGLRKSAGGILVWILVGAALVSMEILFRLGTEAYIWLFCPPIVFSIIITTVYPVGRSKLISAYAFALTIGIPCLIVLWIPVHMVSELIVRGATTVRACWGIFPNC